MKISLTRNQILKALPRVEEGLNKYLILQAVVRNGTDLSRDEVFQKKYNAFYKVRRNKDWRCHYFKLMEEQKLKKTDERSDFLAVLSAIQRNTGRVEASFASKLVATIDSSLPVIDSVVFKNIGARLPSYKTDNRLAEIAEIYNNITDCYGSYLISEDGIFLVQKFRHQYPEALISNVKILDLVLWKNR